MNALILGTVEFLRSTDGLGLGNEQCDEQPDGQPPPIGGQTYYAITEGEWANEATEYLHENYGVEVWITLKAGVAPSDRVNVELKRKLRTLAAQVRAKIHGSDLLRIRANTHLNAASENVFLEPLRFRNASKIMPKGPDWFWAEADSDRPVTGIAMVLTFGGAVRAQTIESQT